MFLASAKIKEEDLKLEDIPKLLNSLIKMTTFLYIMMVNMVIKQDIHTHSGTNNDSQEQEGTSADLQ